MDQQTLTVAHDERSSREPIDQRFTVRRGKNGIERVAAMRFPVPRRDGQQMKVVVAKDGTRGIAQRDDFAEHLQRLRSAIDEIAHQPQAIVAGGKPYQVEQLAQLGMTSLNVADRVERHGTRRYFAADTM